MPPPPLFTRRFLFAFASNLLMGITFALFIHYAGFLTELGADEPQIGLIVGVGSLGSLLLRPYVGQLMDRIGRLPLIHAGNVINLASTLLYLTVTEISWWVYALTIIHGFAEAILYTALTTYGADIIPAERRTEGLSFFGVSGQLPIALGGLLGDLILRRGDYSLLFIVSAGIGGLALLAGLTLREVERSDVGIARGFFHVVRQAPLLPLWLLSSTFAVAVVSFFTFLKTYVIDTGIGSVGTFFALYSLTAILLRVVGNRLPRIFGELRVLVASQVALALGLLSLALAGSDSAVAISGILCGAGHGFAFPILYSLVVTRSAEADRGSALSGFLSFFPLAGLFGAPILGGLIKAYGYPTMYMTVAVGVALVTLVFVAWERGRLIAVPA